MILIIRRSADSFGVRRSAQEKRQWKREGNHSLTVGRGYLALVVSLPVDQMVQYLLVRQFVVSERKKERMTVMMMSTRTISRA